MRRKWTIWLLLLALVGIAGTHGMLWLTTPTPGLTEENVRRLRAGMTVQDVERLFGGPATYEPIAIAERPLVYAWTGSGGFQVTVWFDKGGFLSNALMLQNEPWSWTVINVNESLLDTLKRWFHGRPEEITIPTL